MNLVVLFLPNPVFIDFIQTFCRTVRIFWLAFLSVWCIMLINITKQPTKPFLMLLALTYAVSVCPAAIVQILDCTISLVGLHSLSFGLHKLVGLQA